MPLPPNVNWDLVHQTYRDHIRLFCQRFFPHGREVGHEWWIGSISGEKGDSLKIELDDLQKAGLWTDFATGEHGSFLDLLRLSRGWSLTMAAEEIAATLGINPDQWAAAAGPSPAGQYQQAAGGGPNGQWEPYRPHAIQLNELAKWRGLSPESCKYFADGNHIGRSGPHWVFPVWHSGQLIAVHKRISKNEWYYEPKGCKTYPLIIGDLAKAQIIWTEESPWDLMTALDALNIWAGNPVAGIATRGAGNARLLKGIQFSGQLYSSGQNDGGGTKWMTELAAIRSFKHVPVPDPYHDLNDWIKDGGAADFMSAFDAAQLYGAASILDWFKAKKVEELSAVEPVQVIKGMLYAGQKLSVTGGSKQFKSWLLLYIAFCIANGLNILTEFATVRLKVAIIDFELLGYSIRKRLETIQDALASRGIGGNFDNIRVFNLRGLSRRFKGNLDTVCAELQRQGFKVVIFDPMYKMMIGGDENSNSFVAEVLERMTELCMQSETAFFYVHHHSKGSQGEKEAIDRGSGAGSFGRDGDTLIDLTPHEQSTKAKPLFTVTVTLRDFNSIDDFVIHWEFPLFVKDVSGLDPADVKKRKAQSAQKTYIPATDALKFITRLETITKKEFITRMTTEDKNGHKFCAERRAWEIIKELIAIGELDEDRTAHPPTVCRA